MLPLIERPVLPAVQDWLSRHLDWETAIYGALVCVALMLRIWDVGARAMHHDESLHATYAWYLFKGRGYHYDPVTHGPLQFFVMAFFYLLFGDSETTARLFAVLCGTGLVVLPYFLRREMGSSGAMIASLALTISPAFLYFSRFARDDVPLDFFSLLMVVALWRYLHGRQTRWVYVMAMSAALAMATMEAAYITFFILGSFIILAGAKEWLSGARTRLVLGGLRTISLDTWLYAAALFVVITILLFSSFLSNPDGVWDPRYTLLSPNRQDILGGITYWISQHGVARGGQPWFYYLLLFGLYEQFAVLFGVAGAIWAFLRRDLFTTFLLYWAVLALAIYSWAGEKMPWLFLHPLLPVLLLAAAFAGRMLSGLGHNGRILLTVALSVLLLVELHSAQAVAYADGANPTEMLVYVQTSNDVPSMARESIRLVRRLPAPTGGPLIQVDDNDLGGWPFEWYFRNLPPGDVSYDSVFSGSTAPVLIMLGPEYDLYGAHLARRYEVSRYRWNWWFPEDYKGLTFDDGRCGTVEHETACAPGQTGTVFLKTGNPCPPSALVGAPVPTNCSPIQTPSAINIFQAIADGATWQHIWSWFVFRTPFGQRGARMLYLLVRKDLTPRNSGSITASPSLAPPPSVSPVRYRRLSYRVLLVMANRGRARVMDPHGLAIAPDGTLYVADSGNHRVVELSTRGRFVRAFGSAGRAPGQFNADESPIDVAVSRSDRLYVADWWGNRIEEFTAAGRFVRLWGHYGTHGGYGFFGPRSVTLGPSGRVYVADTGNRQIAAFSAKGTLLFRFGRAGPLRGELDEPSAVVTGRHGMLYVADMWNSRVEVFTPRGHYVDQWAVPSWTYGSYEEPYEAVLPDGNLVVSDPANSRLLEFSPAGKAIGMISVPGLRFPAGLATSRNGTIFVSDSVNDDIIAIRPAAHR